MHDDKDLRFWNHPGLEQLSGHFRLFISHSRIGTTPLLIKGEGVQPHHVLYFITRTADARPGGIKLVGQKRWYAFQAGYCYAIPAQYRFAYHFPPGTGLAAFHTDLEYSPGLSVLSGADRIHSWIDSDGIGERLRALQPPADGLADLLLIRSQILLAMARLADQLGSDLTRPFHVQQRYRHLLQILADVDGQTRLADIAAALGRSAQGLSRQFSKDFGYPLKTAIQRAVIRRAQQRLVNEQHLPVKILAEDLNFSDEHYFSRAFKRVTGMSPRTYRQQQRSPGTHRDT